MQISVLDSKFAFGSSLDFTFSRLKFVSVIYLVDPIWMPVPRINYASCRKAPNQTSRHRPSRFNRSDRSWRSMQCTDCRSNPRPMREPKKEGGTAGQRINSGKSFGTLDAG